ncbi:MAG TPA: non-heme iron oxygenase ferredoxin subunit [Patescibacteria group bacterium]|jgi:3-phenylpropionate/trans-cinnamate dioxygenase ferredoxin subunit|nr:non-heme iron oxygenase ferredoxin subunit [Patescibacteria group bacterium]
MSEFVPVAMRDEVPPGARKLIDFDAVSVVLFNIGGDFYCIEDVCTHDGGPVGEGDIEGCSIECPRHGARFDLRDGSVLSMPAVVPIPTYQVKLDGNQVFIESPDDW